MISGETNQEFVPLSNGEYAVEVSQNGCADTSTCYLIYIVGISENESDEIRIYPNPVGNALIIEREGNIETISFEIYNSIGQNIFNGNLKEKTIIQTANFPSGVYLIKLENGKSFEFKKFLKE